MIDETGQRILRLIDVHKDQIIALLRILQRIRNLDMKNFVQPGRLQKF